MTIQLNGANGSNSGDNRQPEMSRGLKKKKGSALKYFLLPGIIPEIKELSRSKFGYLAYLIAMIYQIVRILPANHPYTKPENIGRFSVRQVIAIAANHVKVNRKNIDQIIVFIAILAGLILIVLQFISFLFFLFIGDAWAGSVPAEAASLFVTAAEDTDIAFHMIREVFGLPTMFGTLQGGPTALHLGLQTLFQFYNFALLFVGVLIFLYYVIVVVAETAQTGVPFGRRFSHIYAPFRLVIAIGLLVPLNYGFNGSQYIAFYAAKLGSSFATNGWLRFNKSLSAINPIGTDKETLIAEPNMPDLTGLVEAMSVINACRYAYGIPKNEGGEEIEIVPYFVNIETNDALIDTLGTGLATYNTIKNLVRTTEHSADISIYFGEVRNTGAAPAQATNHPGNATPYCGSIKLPIQLDDMPAVNATGIGSPDDIQENYYLLIYRLWDNPVLKALGERIAYAHHAGMDPCVILGVLPGGAAACNLSYKPPREVEDWIRINEITRVHALMANSFQAARNQIDYTVEAEILLTGWGGAGIWYNKIAQINGAFVTAVMNTPTIGKRPMVMEKTSEAKQKTDSAYIDCKSYEANIADNDNVKFGKGETDSYYSKVLNETYQYWRCDRDTNSSNIFWDSMSAVFGLNGLFQIRQQVNIGGAGGTATVHPLAQLSAVGKGLIESAVRNMGMAMASSFGGGMLGILSQHMGSGLQAMSQMFISIATVGLSVGFILFYILPFLPFMYFFFAVGGWVKGLFEAMVGAPLWALAHLRIDGDGLPGRSAMNGYLLIFEIFVRPILTVFGLIGGMAIFTAMANMLNEVFHLVVQNITGSDIDPGLGAPTGYGRHIVDEFFFTVVYAIILYMMAMASFKMITLVPNNILRWLGQSVQSFNDGAGDPAAGLTQYAALGGARIGGQLAQGATQLSRGLGSAGGEAVGLATRGSGKP